MSTIAAALQSQLGQLTNGSSGVTATAELIAIAASDPSAAELSLPAIARKAILGGEDQVAIGRLALADRMRSLEDPHQRASAKEWLSERLGQPEVRSALIECLIKPTPALFSFNHPQHFFDKGPYIAAVTAAEIIQGTLGNGELAQVRTRRNGILHGGNSIGQAYAALPEMIALQEKAPSLNTIQAAQKLISDSSCIEKAIVLAATVLMAAPNASYRIPLFHQLFRGPSSIYPAGALVGGVDIYPLLAKPEIKLLENIAHGKIGQVASALEELTGQKLARGTVALERVLKLFPVGPSFQRERFIASALLMRHDAAAYEIVRAALESYPILGDEGFRKALADCNQ